MNKLVKKNETVTDSVEVPIEQIDGKAKKFEHINVYMFKSKNNKSVTIPVKKTDFPEGSDELVLNVSLKGLREFLDNEEYRRFGLNRIRGV